MLVAPIDKTIFPCISKAFCYLSPSATNNPILFMPLSFNIVNISPHPVALSEGLLNIPRTSLVLPL